MNKSKDKSKLVNIIALFLGCVVGCVLNVTGHISISHTVFAPIGSLYVRILQFVALPMIFCLVIVSITSQPSIKKIASLAYKTIFCNIVSAILIGIITFCVTIFFVAHNYLTLATASHASKHVAYAQNYMDLLMNTVKSGVIGRYMQQNLFFVFIVAISFGILMVLHRKTLDSFADMINAITSVLKKMLDLVVKFAPIAIFSIVANAFASNDLSTLRNLLGLIGMACVIAVSYVLVATLIEAIVTKRSFISCLVTTYPAIFFGFVTCSSVACIPLTQQCADELGCRKETSSFVVPLANLLIKAGGTLSIYSLITFTIVAGGNVMPLYKWFYMIFLVMACALAMPAVPMAAIFVIPTALTHLGITMNQNLTGLLIAVYTFIDMFGTAATCASNVFCAVIVDKLRLCKR
ncbi:MAG: cation:dicarboxylase symporter family transporter [Synergistaceae bacterium]|nr:cation:dicarboxylase symporter family transporter [Synergistaceae bacterium]